MYRIAKNFRKSVKKYDSHGENFHRLLAFAVPKDATFPISQRKLSWIATKLWNYSPTEDSRYTVYVYRWYMTKCIVIKCDLTVLLRLQFNINFVQLFRHFCQLLLCLYHTYTISFLDKLGKGHDAAVLGWKAMIQQERNGSQVNNLHPIHVNYQHFNTNCMVARWRQSRRWIWQVSTQLSTQ